MTHHVWKRRLAKLSRWLHIYGSMASFVIVLFFAVTGYTLNHAEWFAGRERVRQWSGTVDPHWTKTVSDAEVSKLQIVERLRADHGIQGALADFRVEAGQCAVSFKGPGYAADAVIDRDTGHYELTESRLGLAAVINDLHKGRDTGPVWRGVIDVSAVLLGFIALTGLVLLYFVHRYRVAGIVLLTVAGILTYSIYAMWVP